MPELAEVEYFRRQWPLSPLRKILAVEASGRRVFRGVDLSAMRAALRGAALLQSHAHGKQLLFRFSGGAWLGVHLGMTGKLRVAPEGEPAGKHDHLVLRQKGRSLAFTDPRQFGRIRFDTGPDKPPWWRRLPPSILSPQFTLKRTRAFLTRRGRGPVKAVLLMQQAFPGIGNWMADEILWRSRVSPRRLAGSLSPAETARLHASIRAVSRAALKTIGRDWGDPPKGWLIHRRWKPGGHCPRDGAPLSRATIGGRTTCWCAKCQK